MSTLPQTNCDQKLHSLYMWLIFHPSPWLIHVPIMTLMPTSQMEVRDRGTTNTILLQDARNLTGVPKMVTQPAQHQAFPLKALTTPKPEGSVSRRKTIVQTLDKGPCGKKRWRRFSCIRGVLKVLSCKEFNFRLSQSHEEKMPALTSDTAGQGHVVW